MLVLRDNCLSITGRGALVHHPRVGEHVLACFRFGGTEDYCARLLRAYRLRTFLIRDDARRAVALCVVIVVGVVVVVVVFIVVIVVIQGLSNDAEKTCLCVLGLLTLTLLARRIVSISAKYVAFIAS